MALGYSVVNGTNVFPGIRYTGRRAGDPLGQMTLGRGHSRQRHRDPDHHQLALGRLHVDERRPTDDCTFWYVKKKRKNSEKRKGGGGGGITSGL